MRSPSKKQKFAFILFLFFSILFSSFYFFNGAFVSFGVKKIISRFLPGATWRSEKFVIYLNRAEIRHFTLQRKINSLPLLEIKDVNGYARFSIFSFLKAKPYSFVALTVSGVNVGDIKINDLKISINMFADSIVLKEMQAFLLGGEVSGEGRYLIGPGKGDLSLALRASRINLKDLLKALQASKGVEANGAFSGDIKIGVLGNNIVKLEGDLKSDKGGDFVITDTSMLDKNLPAGTGANIVVENLKNYHYDIGSIKISNNGQGIKLEISLEGQAGKRNFEITWH